MFENLSGRLGDVLSKLKGRGALSEKDVDEAMREVRRALLEADVALPVARSFIDRVKERAVGQEVLKSVTPGQQVIKIVHDELVEMLGGAEADSSISLRAASPVVLMMVGLQGSGKTTSTAKIAKRLTAETEFLDGVSWQGVTSLSKPVRQTLKTETHVYTVENPKFIPGQGVKTLV